MSRSTGTGQPPSWRGDARPKRRREATSSSKYTRAAVVGAFMLLVAAAAGFLIWRSWPDRSAALLVVANTRSGRPTAWADVAWLKSQVKVSNRVVDQSYNTLDLESAAASLAAKKPGEPVILFVSAPAHLDGSGKVVISTAERGELRLDELLKTVRACKSSRKLLVFDLDEAPEHSSVGLPRDDIAGALSTEIAKLQDPSLFVLLPARPGETSRASETLGRSVFADAVGRALGENADDADRAGNGDKIVSVDELANYVNARVDDWSEVHFGDHQRPTLAAGGDARTFLLSAVVPSFVKQAKEKAKVEAAKSLPPKIATSKPNEGDRPVVVEGYPANLKAGWERRDRWRRRRFFEVAPRPYRRLESALLAAEYAWRYGRATNKIDEQILTPALDQADKDEREWDVTYEGQDSPTRSLAKALVEGYQPVPALNRSVSELARQIGRAKNEELAPTWDAIAKANPPGDREKSFALAHAVIAAAREKGPRLAPLRERLKQLDTWLRGVQEDADFAETAALSALASVADQWPEETLADALELACEGETLDARPRALNLYEKDLKDAADLRHRAEIGLQSHGYIPDDLAVDAVDAARKAVTSIKARFTPVDRADRLTQGGLITLIELAPYVDDAGPDALGDWRAAATALVAMQRRLAAGDLPTVLDNDNLEATLSRAVAPFEPRGILARIAESKDEARARAGEFKLLNALLASARPTAAERLSLLDAERDLGRRLDEAHQGHDFTPSDDSASDESEDRPDPRREIASVLLSIAGGDSAVEEPAPASAFVGRWNKVAEAMSKVTEMTNATKSQRDLLTRIVPLWVSSGDLDDRDNSPEFARRGEELAAGIRWLSGRYSYEANDLGASAFVRESADVYRALVGGGRPPHFEMELATPIELGRDGKARGSLSLIPANLPKEKTAKSVRILKPDDPRLLASLSTTADGTAGGKAEVADVNLPGQVVLDVAWNEADVSAQAPASRPSGLLVQVDWAGRTYSTKVPISGIPAGDEPEVLLSADGGEAQPAPSTLALRPLLTPQAFGLSIRNPAKTERTLVVEVNAAGSTIRTAPFPVPPGTAVPVKLDGAAKPTGEPPELTGAIVVRVLDQEGKVELNRKEFDVSVHMPKEYVTFVPGTARYYPKAPAHPERNRLQVQVRPRGLRRGDSPSTVTLILPAEIDPAGAPKEFQPSVALDPDQPEGVTLFAEDFSLKSGLLPPDSVFYVGVDRDPRVYKFRVNLTRGGAERTATPDESPEILPFDIPAAIDSATVEPFDVIARVDNAPKDAVMRFSISLLGANGKLNVDKEEEIAGIRRGVVRVSIDPSLGLVFDVSVTEPRWPLKLSGRGRRVLRAELFEAGIGARRVAERSMEILLDDRPAQNLEFTKPTKPIAVGATAAEVAAKGQSDSGIQAVNFYIGKPPEKPGDKPAGELVAAKPDPTRQIWSANLPVQAAAPGQLDLTVQFTNGIGRVSYKSMKLDVRDAAVAAMDAAKTGTITGTVNYRFSLSNQEVLLLDAAGKELKRTKSDDNGKFTFSGVDPGTYKVSSTRRESFVVRGSAEVTVVAGETAKVKLELSR